MNTTFNDKDKLYRFISYERLLDILVNGRFVLVKYKLFDDPWEGFFHKAFFKENENDSYSVLGENRPFIMCFTKRQHSDAMWRIYSKSSDGVQISTTVAKLKKLTKDSHGDFDCYLKEVIYNDDIIKDDFFIKKFAKATLSERRIECLFHKRTAFDHEEEVRLVLYAKQDMPDRDIQIIYADPNEIIDTIVLDPRSDKKVEDLHIKTLFKLGFKNIIKRSDLYNYKRVWYKTKE